MARRRRATEAERALWGAAMRHVHRLHPGDPTPPPEPEPVITAPIVPPVEATAAPAARIPGPVDPATVQRLRRGRVNVEARIDLHGMDQKQAFGVLMGFVGQSVHAGRRAILVITGKGAPAQGGGVLRRNAPGWLMASPHAHRILTIQPAHATHGGDGAFYVLLRRAKHAGSR